MKPFIADLDFTLYVGDVREVLAQLPDESVDCVVTSPPYWGLRDYGTGSWEGGEPDCEHEPVRGLQGAEGQRASRTFTGSKPQMQTCSRCGASRVDRQIGLESSPEEFVEALVAVFAEVRRVLAPHGTCWVNLGDSYASKTRGSDLGWETSRLTNPGGVQKAQAASLRKTGERHRGKGSGLKEKDLVGIPWRVAFALQEDGWYLRADVVWSKPNPMPESVTDRPTKSHEYVFLLTKSPRYYYDADAVRESFSGTAHARGKGLNPKALAHGDSTARVKQNASFSGSVNRVLGVPPPQLETLDGMNGESPRGPDGRRKLVHDHSVDRSHENYSNMGTAQERWPNGGRNLRSVWEIPTQPYPEAHFATYPEALVERCVKAGCPEQVCRSCGKPRVRRVDVDYENPGNRSTNGPRSEDRKHQEFGTAGYAQRLERRSTTVGWSSCECADYRAGVVLDPFIGSGTTALVARRLERHAIGIELNEEYAALCARRLQQLSLLAEGEAA